MRGLLMRGLLKVAHKAFQPTSLFFATEVCIQKTPASQRALILLVIFIFITVLLFLSFLKKLGLIIT